MDKLILVTNDDGIHAKGLQALTELACLFGRVVVISTTEPMSGMSHAITVKHPVRLHKVDESANLVRYCCNGTPADCVKMALSQIIDRKPDLLLSGFNHGSNSSTSVVYSGTMSAALEGAINNIPSIGLSLLNYSPQADFTSAKIIAERIIRKALEKGIPPWVCLNVNIPAKEISEIKEIRICRQTRGFWKEEFEKRVDPAGYNYYWLTGEFEDLEPQATDTDEFALKNDFVSIVPIQFDLTAYKAIKELKEWNLKKINEQVFGSLICRNYHKGWRLP